MKRSLTLLVVACLALGAAGWQVAGKGDEEAAVKARADGFAAAWNKHDATEMASFWAPEGDLINPFGRVAKGRAAVQKLFADEHAGMTKDSHFQVKVSGMRFLADGAVAVTDWDVTVTNMKGEDGATIPSKEFRGTFVMQKTKGVWLIEAGRPYVILPAGKPEPKPAK
jgi:uncharacterized protein (TIGR02246 family)